MRYNDDNEMCISILKNINLGIVPDLKSRTGSPPWQLNRCLNLLQKKSLIKNEDGAQIYEITEKGVQYLYSYNKIIELLSHKTDKKEEIIAQLA